MSILWLKFAEDTSLPDVLDSAGRERLEKIFSSSDPVSNWTSSLKILGLTPSQAPMIKWVGGLPYINWSEMVRLVSGGCIFPVRTEGGGYGFQTRYTLGTIWGLMVSQWRIAHYTESCLKRPLPDKVGDRITESLAFGVALLSLTLRLPAHDARTFSDWIVNPPPPVRKTIQKIQALQKRRTELTSAWQELFPVTYEQGDGGQYPAHFWDEPPEIKLERERNDSLPRKNIWRGIRVCGDFINARVVLIEGRPDLDFIKSLSDPLVLIFPRARPETVELFPYAAAVLYGEGGTLSHACTIARETNLPCITALGQGFVADIRDSLATSSSLWLSINPERSEVSLISPLQGEGSR